MLRISQGQQCTADKTSGNWLSRVRTLGFNHDLRVGAFALRLDLCVEVSLQFRDDDACVAAGDPDIADLHRTVPPAPAGRKPEIRGSVRCFGGQDFGAVNADHRQHQAVTLNIAPYIRLDLQRSDCRQRRVTARPVRRICDHHVVRRHFHDATKAQMQMCDRHLPTDRGGGMRLNDRDEPVPVRESHQ
jgi:hypothetical protein